MAFLPSLLLPLCLRPDLAIYQPGRRPPSHAAMRPCFFLLLFTAFAAARKHSSSIRKVLRTQGQRGQIYVVTHRHFRLQTNFSQLPYRADEVCKTKYIFNAIGHLATLLQRNCGRNCSSLESFLRSKSQFGVTDRRKKRKNVRLQFSIYTFCDEGKEFDVT
jgi:hypothetical protein